MKGNLLAFVLVCGSAMGSSWQPTGGKPVPSPVPAGSDVKKANEGAKATPAPQDPAAKIDINFSGGTVGEFAAVLRQASGDTENLIVSPTVESLQLPAISLRRANVMTALRAMASSLDDQVGINVIGAEADGFAPVISLFANQRFNQPQSPSTPNLAVFPITDGVGPKMEALSAIENGLTMLSSGKPPKVNFHETSGLLFVMGTNTQVAAAQEVLEALERRSGGDSAKQLAQIGQKLMSELKVKTPSEAMDRIPSLVDKASRHDGLQLDLATLKATSAAELRLAARDAEVKTAMERDRLAAAEKAMADANAQIAKDRSEAAQRDMTIDALTKQLARAENEATAFREERKKMDDENRKLRQIIDKLEADLVRAQQEAAAKSGK